MRTARRIREQGMLTLSQIEDYLIHHCPMLRATPMDTGYKLSNEQLREHPFMVEFRSPSVDFQSVDATPWDTYKELACMIYADIAAHAYITELYKHAIAA